MTTVKSGSESVFFHNRQQIVDHLLKNILANDNRNVGTEWEMFFVRLADKSSATPITHVDGRTIFPITIADGQKVFEEFRKVFALMGYESEYLYEQNNEKKVGLNVRGLGTITPEIGHQFEFSCSVCENCEEIEEKNEEFQRAVSEVAHRLGYVPVYIGYLPGHSEHTEGTPRSRSLEWENLWALLGPEAKSLRQALDGTASVQVTIDAGAENFHEFYKALLLIEPALSLHYANSQRSHTWINGFETFLPAQVRPITEVWNAKNPRDAVEAIVDRLLKVELPFLPDPDRQGAYSREPFIGSRPATAFDLMQPTSKNTEGRLSQKALNNVGGFVLTRPAFKNFSKGLLEMRGVDSQTSPAAVAEIAQRVTALLYDDAARGNLLKVYTHLTPADIRELHRISTMKDRNEALETDISGMGLKNIVTMADFVHDILSRSETANPHLSRRPVRARRMEGYEKRRRIA